LMYCSRNHNCLMSVLYCWYVPIALCRTTDETSVVLLSPRIWALQHTAKETTLVDSPPEWRRWYLTSSTKPEDEGRMGC
jgi:hypothetical protein